MDGERNIIDGGAVALAKDRIIDVGASAQLEARYQPKQSIDATGMVVLPGLINAHTHIGMHLARGLGDDIDLMEAYRTIYLPFGWYPTAQVAPRDVFNSAMLACLELITSGSTCLVDMNPQPQEVARALEASGLRGVVSPTMMDTWLGDGKPVLADRAKVIGEAEDLIREWNGRGDGRIQDLVRAGARDACLAGVVHRCGEAV